MPIKLRGKRSESIIKNFIRRILSAIDSRFQTSLLKILKEKKIKFKEVWHNSNFLSAIRCSINYVIIKLKYRLGMNGKNPLKLHLGCGSQHLEGYMNIDWRKTGATDIVCDLTKLPYPDHSVELIETCHVIEHLSRHDLPRVFKKWYLLLIQEGKLIIECPNFDEVVKEYMKDEKRIDNIFGLQRYHGDAHQFGYNFKRLKKLMEDAGFKNIQQKEPQNHHSENEPCLRVECVK